ncbi:hypothetical protein LTR66_017004, partial [Elasticomyces elasticus]
KGVCRPGVEAAEVGAVEYPTESSEARQEPFEASYGEPGEDKETQEADALPPLLYPDDGDLPIFARDGDEEMRWRDWSSFLRPLSFGASPACRGTVCGLAGVPGNGASRMDSIERAAMVGGSAHWLVPQCPRPTSSLARQREHYTRTAPVARGVQRMR